MSKLKSGLKTLYGSKLGKLLPVLVIAGLVATSSATVFAVYYGQTTATVAIPKVQLVAGSDATSSSVYKPTVSVPGGDLATVGVTLFPMQTNAGAQPNIYYTDLLEVHNSDTTNSYSVISVAISNIVDASSSLGEIDVYYCITQTNAPAAGTNCELYAITSTTAPAGSGSLTFPHALAASGTNYIEIVAHAASTATAASTVSFNVQISWA